MKEIIFEHKQKECKITLYRRFLPININYNNYNSGYTFFDESKGFTYCEPVKYNNDYNKNTEYFDCTNQIKCDNIHHTFKTNNTNVIKKLYPDPFAEIDSETKHYKIIKDGDKIKIIIKTHSNIRKVNRKFFKESYHMSMLMFNTATNNITACEIIKNGKKKVVKIRTNCFNFIERVSARLMDRRMPGWHEAIMTAVNIDITCPETILYNFVKIKQIKTPNEYFDLLKYYYPGQKFLKKNDNKLIQAILDKQGVKSKRTNSILNMRPYTTTLSAIKAIVNLFGINYIQYIKIFDQMPNTPFSSPRDVKPYPINLISHNEKMNLINIINSLDISILYLQEFDDHLFMISAIKNSGGKFKIKAKTMKEFYSEHNLLTTMHELLRKGKYINITYSERLSILEIPILHENIAYTPHVLKTEHEYILEGCTMHHCVSSYITKPDSLIISLRKESEQVTIEYDTKSGDLIQKQFYCNTIPPEDFNEPILTLSKKVKKLAKDNLLQRVNTEFIKINETPEKVNENPELDAVYEVNEPAIFF